MTTVTEFPISKIPVVNVAAVPQRSPLRYPGGKTWLVPHIREWLKHADAQLLIEPFAGGGIVTLTAIAERLVDEAIMLEIDRDVAAFWRGAFDDGATLAEWVRKFKPTPESLNQLLSKPPESLANHAFRNLALNRTRRGGILAPGASLNRQGENGKGLLSRWYPDTLAKRLLALEKYKDRITFLEGDGLKLLPSLLRGWGKRAAVFLDPPYTAGGGKKAGSRLYAHSKINHAKLFAVVAEYSPSFLMTYDASPEIVELVRKYDFDAVLLSMKNTHHNKMAELVITSEPLFA